MEWMIRDWVNWCWLSGDHIVEQHVHNLDVIHWFAQSHPVKAVGLGGRARRVTGDQYDFFSIDYELESGVHVHSMCRQIDGCADNVSEFVSGSEGSTNCKDTIYGPKGEEVWKFGAEVKPEDEESEPSPNSPYLQEHIDLVTAIRTEKPMNEAVNTALSTLTAIMGRTSAYTGGETSWGELMASDLRLGPQNYELGPVDMEAVVPVPGSSKEL
jgi:predicted dehydrogenase